MVLPGIAIWHELEVICPRDDTSPFVVSSVGLEPRLIGCGKPECERLSHNERAYRAHV